MYSAPRLESWVEIHGMAPGSDQRELLPGLPDEIRRVRDDFLRVRRGLRKLVEPDALAEALFDYYPGPGEITIVVVQPVLNRKTAKIDRKLYEYTYHRPA